MNDDLFQPTIGAKPVVATPPWRPDSIVYPAFFGGPLAATVLGLINGRRLALGNRQLLAVLAAGVAAIIGRIVATDLLSGQVGTRILGAAAGLVAWGAVAATQKRAFRAYALGGREPAGLIGPGFAAAIGCGLLEILVITLVVS